MSRIHSVSISGELVLDMHALNNEAAEGNQQIARMVHIVDRRGKLVVVNAVSGDMLKHIQAQHFHGLAEARKLPLCGGCVIFDANRVNLDADFIKDLPTGDNAVGLDKVIQHCALDDAEGVLITAGNRSMARKSTVEFAWLVGLPNHTRTESYFHVKYDPRSRGEGSGGAEGANVGQNIFYRPASSGVYAAVVTVELARVGWNDLTRTYAVAEEERRLRARTVLESVAHTFVRPSGAHRNTQNPHILDFRGVVSVSSGPVPAPTISPLGGGCVDGDEAGAIDYVAEVRGVAEQLNRSWPDAVSVREFGSLAEFIRVMADMLEAA